MPIARSVLPCIQPLFLVLASAQAKSGNSKSGNKDKRVLTQGHPVPCSGLQREACSRCRFQNPPVLLPTLAIPALCLALGTAERRSSTAPFGAQVSALRRTTPTCRLWRIAPPPVLPQAGPRLAPSRLGPRWAQAGRNEFRGGWPQNGPRSTLSQTDAYRAQCAPVYAASFFGACLGSG